MPTTSNFGWPYPARPDPLTYEHASGEAYLTQIDADLASNVATLTSAVADVEADLDTRGRGLTKVTTSTSSSGTVTSAETVVATLSNVTFEAGRAYRASFGRMMSVATLSTAVLFRVRKTNAAGTDWGVISRYINPIITLANHAQGVGYLIRSAGSDLTGVTVVLTMQLGSGTGVHYAEATAPRFFLLEDVGPASAYAGLGVEVS